MRPGQLVQRLRFRLLATHLLSGLAGVLGFLVVSAVLALSLPHEAEASDATQMLAVLAGGTVAGALIAGLVALAASSWLFAHIAQPLRRMTKMARRVARGNYSERFVARSNARDGVGPGTRSGSSGNIGSTRNAGEAPGTQATKNLDDVTGALASALDDLAASLEATEHRRTLSFGEVAHEIRTPVAVLEGYLEGLLDGHVKASDKTWAMLYDEASRVHRLVDELQALSRAETRQTYPDLQAVDPAEIARVALERLRLHFEEKGLQVAAEIAPSLPRVLADQDQAQQALGNLLTNAFRYTPAPGRVTVSVNTLPGTNEVVFKVSDTGVGIAAEHIPHLFERFFRIDRAGSRKVVGSGIGLPVAKALVEAMGGRIWAESPGPGKGSTFSFTLLATTPGAELDT